MLKFNVRRAGSLIAGELHGIFISPSAIKFKNEISAKDLSGLILPHDHLQWVASDGKPYSAVILKVSPLFPEEMPMVGKGATVTLDQEISDQARK
ncbi:hypothetical protein ACFL5G_01740 [Candidatus Margulisiibacteriota bacterium]